MDEFNTLLLKTEGWGKNSGHPYKPEQKKVFKSKFFDIIK